MGGARRLINVEPSADPIEAGEARAIRFGAEDDRVFNDQVGCPGGIADRAGRILKAVAVNLHTLKERVNKNPVSDFLTFC